MADQIIEVQFIPVRLISLDDLRRIVTSAPSLVRRR